MPYGGHVSHNLSLLPQSDDPQELVSCANLLTRFVVIIIEAHKTLFPETSDEILPDKLKWVINYTCVMHPQYNSCSEWVLTYQLPRIKARRLIEDNGGVVCYLYELLIPQAYCWDGLLFGFVWWNSDHIDIRSFISTVTLTPNVWKHYASSPTADLFCQCVLCACIHVRFLFYRTMYNVNTAFDHHYKVWWTT